MPQVVEAMKKTLSGFGIAAVVIAAGLSAVAFPGQIPPSSLPPAKSAIPMKDYGGRPVLEVVVNGKGPFPFILDTAASGGRIGTKLIDSLGLEPIGEARVRSGVGELIPAKLYRLETLRVDGLALRGVDAIAMDPGETDRPGVLPLNAFAGFLLILNFADHKIIAETGELPPADGTTILEYSGRLLSFPATIGGVAVTIHPDTGSPSGVTVPLALAERLPLAEPPRVVGRGKTVNADIEISAAPLKGQVRWGNVALENPTLDMIPGLREPLMGCAVLNRFAVTIDQANKRIRFVEGPHEPGK
jgi:hypothetical protein